MQRTGNELAVIALAGRRVDAEDTNPPRFPLANVPMVRQRLNELLRAEHAVAIVCSAACGADLVALVEAERLGIRGRIVLPFAPARFRETSVIDRPGDWATAFDRLVANAQRTNDLVVIDSAVGDDDAAYAAANGAIVREAQQLARKDPGSDASRLIAAIVWEGAARSEADATEGFRTLAVGAGFEERFVLTR
jgi:hypothetical protein